MMIAVVCCAQSMTVVQTWLQPFGSTKAVLWLYLFAVQFSPIYLVICDFFINGFCENSDNLGKASLEFRQRAFQDKMTFKSYLNQGWLKNGYDSYGQNL